MPPFVHLVLSGIALVAGTYLLLKYAHNFRSEMSTGTQQYGNVARTFQKGP